MKFKILTVLAGLCTFGLSSHAQEFAKLCTKLPPAGYQNVMKITSEKYPNECDYLDIRFDPNTHALLEVVFRPGDGKKSKYFSLSKLMKWTAMYEVDLFVTSIEVFGLKAAPLDRELTRFDMKMRYVTSRSGFTLHRSQHAYSLYYDASVGQYRVKDGNTVINGAYVKVYKDSDGDVSGIKEIVGYQL